MLHLPFEPLIAENVVATALTDNPKRGLTWQRA